jgi:hypothetical protein
MASQITHVPYAKKVLDQFLSGEAVDQRKYFVGTLFPDIRYYGVMERDQSHAQNPTLLGLLDIKGDFEKGMYAHALVDVERERLLQKTGIYDLLGKNPYVTNALKIIEDEFTHDLIPEWSKYIDYLNDILDEEINLVPKEVVQKWHGILQVYFSQKPTWESLLEFAKGLKEVKEEDIAKIKIEIERIRKIPAAIGIIQQTYSELFKDD